MIFKHKCEGNLICLSDNLKCKEAKSRARLCVLVAKMCLVLR